MAKTELDNKNIIKTSHELNHFRGGYTPLELDFIYAFISCIKDEDNELHEYKLTVKELEKKLNKELRIKRIEYIFDSLITKSFKINNNQELVVYSFFTKFKYDKEEGTISVKFNPELKPHLIKLRVYAMGNFRYLLSLRGEYSKRLYMLLSQWRTVGEITYTIDQLREMLAIPKSYKYGNIKKEIIIKSQKELIAKAPFYFEYNEIKRGRSVHAIIFTIKANEDRELREFMDMIANEHYDRPLVKFDNRINYCDKQGRLYWLKVDELKETKERIYHEEEYQKSAWRYLYSHRQRLPIYTMPTLFDTID